MMADKFDFKEHEKRMREILKPKASLGQRPKVLQSLLDKVKGKLRV